VKDLDVRLLRLAGLRYAENAIAPGAQTDHRGGTGPVWDLLGGGHAPAALIIGTQVTKLCFASGPPMSTTQFRSQLNIVCREAWFYCYYSVRRKI
jgi:hypothetical protein